MVKIMENPIKIDDLGVPIFLETPICPKNPRLDPPMDGWMNLYSLGVVSFWVQKKTALVYRVNESPFHWRVQPGI